MMQSATHNTATATTPTTSSSNSVPALEAVSVKNETVEAGVVNAKVEDAGSSIAVPAAKPIVKVNAVVVYAKDLNFETDVHIGTPAEVKFNGGKMKMKMANIGVGANDDRKIKVQFCGGGKIPQKFGVEENQYGKTMLTFDVPSDAEYLGLKKAGEQMIKIAEDRSWGTFTAGGDFNKIMADRKPKDNGGGEWPAMFKAEVPMSAQGGVDKSCVIVDYDGTPVSVHALPGREWQAIVCELSFVYFRGKQGWGIGGKKVSKIMLKRDKNTIEETIEFLPMLGDSSPTNNKRARDDGEDELDGKKQKV